MDGPEQQELDESIRQQRFSRKKNVYCLQPKQYKKED